MALAPPQPTPTPLPLLPIGHAGPGRSICGNLVVHANSAIDSALQGDALIARAISRLRNIDLESDTPAKRNGVQELTRIASEISGESSHADGEIKRLRDQADASGAQSADLRVFGDALTGVIGRQRRIASDIGNLLAYVDYLQARSIPSDVTQPVQGDFIPRSQRMSEPQPTPPPVTTYRGGPPNQMARAAAVDFEGRMRGIRIDESLAALHSEAAVSGC